MIYENTDDNKARFLLGELGKKTLICIGINPSTADDKKPDNTITSVKNRANKLGYDGRIMLNIYPQRATNPNNMDIQINNDYHKDNLEHIQSLLSENNCDIWAARGTNIEKRKYLNKCLNDIYKIAKNINRYTVGKKSKKGHPHHPLYLKKDLGLDPFNIEKYINNS